MSTPAQRHAKVWAENYKLIDLQLAPLGLAAMQALQIETGEQVVDIGCGTGQTLLHLAECVGTAGKVIGVDIAPLLLEVARARTIQYPSISTIKADAQMIPLPAKSADVIFSRFGVMGFANPIAAFTNFHRILKPAGRIGFTCWRALADNELDHFPLEAAGLNIPADETPFSFADPDVIRHTLSEAGFVDIRIEAIDKDVSSGTVDDMTHVLTQVGPLGKLLRDDPNLKALAEPRLRQAFADRSVNGTAHLKASIWSVTATAIQ